MEGMSEQWVWVPFEVDKKFDGWRIDQFLAERLTGYSRSKVQKILDEARVHKDGRPAKTHSRIKTGDKVEVAYLRKPEKALAPDATLPVLHEDDDLLIINKPANLLSHPTDKVVHNTVLGILRHSRKDEKPLHLLHRLDRETSGVLALAKNPATARAWTRAMERHAVRKEYVAFVRGRLDPAAGVIDAPIGRQGGPIHVRQWIDAPEAAAAVTRYATERTLTTAQGPVSVVRIFPQTGRLHQIRVHLASRGAPLLGDPLYSTPEGVHYAAMLKGELSDRERQSALGFPRVALHAASLSFNHPRTQQHLQIRAPLAADMAAFLALDASSDDAILASQ